MSGFYRLERDGLVSKVHTYCEGDIFYEITDAGRTETDGWLSSPVVRTHPTRDELTIKLAFTVPLPASNAHVIRLHRASTLRTLKVLTVERDAVSALAT